MKDMFWFKNQLVKKKYLTKLLKSCILPKVIAMEEILEQTLLYDFYGELLTEHQKRVYEDIIFNDLSCSEVAREQGISRQGVHDMIKRIHKILEDYESKLHLVRQFLQTRQKVQQICELTNTFLETKDTTAILQIQELSKEIMKL